MVFYIYYVEDYKVLYFYLIFQQKYNYINHMRFIGIERLDDQR